MDLMSFKIDACVLRAQIMDPHSCDCCARYDEVVTIIENIQNTLEDINNIMSDIKRLREELRRLHFEEEPDM
jgi:hypothetical protein